MPPPAHRDRLRPTQAMRTRCLATVARRCRLARSGQPRLHPAVAEPVGAIAVAASGDEHAVGAGAQRVVDERRRQLRGAQQRQRRRARVGDAREIRTAAGRITAEDDDAAACADRRARPRFGASAASSRVRSAAIGACGMSMPVTRSATERNGVDDGHAPAQMPQPAHRAGSTTACRSAGLPSVRGCIVTAAYGQSAKQRPQPLQLREVDDGGGGRGVARRARNPRQRQQQQREAARCEPQRGGRRRVGEGVNAEIEPVERQRRRGLAEVGRRGARDRAHAATAASARRAFPMPGRAAGWSPAATAAAGAPTSPRAARAGCRCAGRSAARTGGR